jgi:DNA-binding Xre family transcriptional regulator
MDKLPITRTVSSRLYLMGNSKSAVYANHYKQMMHWNNIFKKNVTKAVHISCMQLLKIKSIVIITVKRSTYCSLNDLLQYAKDSIILLGHYALLQKAAKNPRLRQSSHSDNGFSPQNLGLNPGHFT